MADKKAPVQSGKQPSEVILDFSEVKPFEPLDESIRYKCEVKDFKLGESKEKKPKASLVLSITDPEEAKKRQLFREFSLEPQALPFLHGFIKVVDPKAQLDEKFRFSPAKYIGLPVVVTIKNEAYLEQIRSRVQNFYPADSYEG